MNKLNDKSSHNSLLFKQVLKMLEYNFKSLETINTDPKLMEVCKQLLVYLHTFKYEEDILERLSINKVVKRQPRQPCQQKIQQLSEQQVMALSLEDVEKIIHDENNTRKYIEWVAKNRLYLNGLSKFRNRQLLIKKIQSCIDNERTHEIIGIVASRTY
jgi:hypothetical protein